MKLTPEEDFFNALYLSVGQLVVSFSFIDQSLSHWVAMIFQIYKKEHGETKIPHELRRKIEFLGRCFRSIDPIRHLEPQTTAIFKRLHPIIEARHFLIHGVLSKYEPGKQKFTYVRVDVTPKIHKAVSRGFTFERILKIGNDALTLSRETAEFSHRLLDVTVPEDAGNNVASNVRRKGR